MDKFKIGEKIKKRRLEKGITQSALASDKMTRNMLSLIETGKAMPSIENAVYLCEALDIAPSYLFSADENSFIFEKSKKIEYIKQLFFKKDYSYCIKILNSLSSSDDETNYIYAYSAYRLGREFTKKGALLSAEKYLKEAIERAEKTVYNTEEIKVCAPMYLSITKNIEAPLLEFNKDAYSGFFSDIYDLQFFKYLTLDFSFEFDNEIFKVHMEAKALLKKYAYVEAINKLLYLENFKSTDKYDAFVFFNIYRDLETSYKQIGDFENAYRYASKQMSLFSGFKS